MKLLTDRQTSRRTDRHRVKHNLLGGGSKKSEECTWMWWKQIAVEATREHPFFVCSKGWSSCSPRRTMSRYQLQCKELVVGDCCLALSQVMPSTLTELPTAAAAVPSTTVPAKRRSSSESGDGQFDAPLDYSTVGTAST